MQYTPLGTDITRRILQYQHSLQRQYQAGTWLFLV